MEENQCGDVEEEWDEFGEKHQLMHGSDRECNHDELSQNQRRETDGNDVNELILEQNEGSIHYYPT